MPVNRGELLAIADEIQTEVIAIQKRANELQKVMRPIQSLLQQEPVDPWGNKMTTEECDQIFAKAKADHEILKKSK